MSRIHVRSWRAAATVRVRRRRVGTRAVRLGAVSRIECPSSHRSVQNRQEVPRPTVQVVDALKNCRDSGSEGGWR